MSYLGWFGGVEPVPDEVRGSEVDALTGGSIGLFLVLRAFSSGAVALSGVEAIADGVPAFRRPEAKNAATTLDDDGADPRIVVLRLCRSSRAGSTRNRATT
ncbi:MAG: hypothetical protein KatS3mg009_0741 [Acidimicrobiia bacterium]|nr:MAG: hypothetical protein KatS3mg009_0741 [Acidimicrobiia bacterium]